MDTTVGLGRMRHAAWLARLPRTWRVAGGLAAVGIVVLVSPWVLRLLAHAPVICPLRSLLGVPCPGCGTTRAFFALGSGHATASLQLNVLGLVAWLLVELALAHVAGVLSRRRFDQASRVLVAGGLALAVAAWIVTLARRLIF